MGRGSAHGSLASGVSVDVTSLERATEDGLLAVSVSLDEIAVDTASSDRAVFFFLMLCLANGATVESVKAH